MKVRRLIEEKVIVCGGWWNSEIKEKITLRRSVRDDLWNEYCRLRPEVKDLVREKSLQFGMK